MEKIKETINKISTYPVNNVNNEYLHKYVNNVINDKNSGKKKYAYDPNTFKPNTEITIAAFEIAKELNDLSSLAFFHHVVKKIGPAKSYELLSRVKDRIRKQLQGKNPIRFPERIFTQEYKKVIAKMI